MRLPLAFIVIAVSVFQGAEPRVLQHVDPVYPPLAAAARVQAPVRVSVRVAPDGSVQDVAIMEGHQLLNTAALEAVRQWKFTASPNGGTTNVTLQFAMPPPRPRALVTGRVLDPDGRPLAGVSVFARTRTYVGGMPSLSAGANLSGNNGTDASGTYRLSLEPGEYYLSARYKAPDGTNGDGNRYAPRTFYPVATDPLAAVPIRVLAGVDVLADIRIPNAEGVSISGKIVVPDLDAPVRGNLDLRLWRVDPQFAPENIASERPAVSESSETAFDFRNMPPGTYYLVALLGTGPPNWTYSARVVLEARDRAIDDIILALRRNIEFRGRVVSQEGVTTTKFSVGLLSSDDTGGGGFFSPEPNGTIRFFNMPEDKYRLAFQGLAGNDYVRDIRMGATSIYTDGLVEVKGAGPENLQILLSPNGGSITGITQTSLKQPVAAMVYLVPEPSRRRNPMFYRQAESDATGTYRFTGIAPGEYKVFAFETSPPFGSMENAEFLAQFEQRGVAVTVREAQTAAGITVPVIPEP